MIDKESDKRRSVLDKTNLQNTLNNGSNQGPSPLSTADAQKKKPASLRKRAFFIFFLKELNTRLPVYVGNNHHHVY
jgi:hypothetical protein